MYNNIVFLKNQGMNTAEQDLINGIINTAEYLDVKKALNQMGQKLWETYCYNERCKETDILIKEHTKFQFALLDNGRKIILRRDFYHYKNTSYPKGSSVNATTYFYEKMRDDLSDFCKTKHDYSVFFNAYSEITEEEIRIARISPTKPSSRFIHCINVPHEDTRTLSVLQKQYTLSKALELLGTKYLRIFFRLLVSAIISKDSRELALLDINATTTAFCSSPFLKRKTFNFKYKCDDLLTLCNKCRKAEIELAALKSKSKYLQQEYDLLSSN